MWYKETVRKAARILGFDRKTLYRKLPQRMT